MRRSWFPTALLVVFVLLAACGNTIDSPPSAESPSTSRRPSDASSSTPPPTVPRVTNPIETGAFEQNPCSVLTTSQLHELSISTESEPKATESGPGCEWGNVFDDGLTIEGAFLTKVNSSIAVVYKNQQYDTYAYFEPTKINGYPAVFNDVADGRETGGCAISLGLRDKLIYTISLQLGEDQPNYSDPCSALTKVSNMAITTMTQGGT